MTEEKKPPFEDRYRLAELVVDGEAIHSSVYDKETKKILPLQSAEAARRVLKLLQWGWNVSFMK